MIRPRYFDIEHRVKALEEAKKWLKKHEYACNLKQVIMVAKFLCHREKRLMGKPPFHILKEQNKLKAGDKKKVIHLDKS